MCTLHSIIRNTTLAIAIAGFTTLSAVDIMNFQFNDTNGAYLGGGNSSQVVDAGTVKGTWNNGVQARVQNGNLNYGYTSSWRGATTTTHPLDQGTGTRFYREYTLNSALSTSTGYSTYTYEVVIPTFDIRQNWDNVNSSDAGKGIQFSLRNAAQDLEVIVGYQTITNGGVQAFNSYGTGTFQGLQGNAFDTDNDTATKTPSRFGGGTNPGISLKIEGDLSDGSWTASAGDSNHGYTVLQSGTGLSDIASLRIAAKVPTLGSWGGVAGGPWDQTTTVNGDYFHIDSFTLAAAAVVPEPGTFALIAGFLAFSFVAIRRRKA